MTDQVKRFGKPVSKSAHSIVLADLMLDAADQVLQARLRGRPGKDSQPQGISLKDAYVALREACNEYRKYRDCDRA